MSNKIINQQKQGEIANQTSQNTKSNFASSIEEISSDNTKILFFTKPVVHTVGVGINPLVDAAAYIFTWMGKLVEMRSQQNLQQLHFELVKEIREFRSSLTALDYMPQYLSECIPITTYVLCTTLDTIIENTVWGQAGKWNKYRLLNSYHQEILSRENFLILLERFIQDPKMFIDMIEFIYICLNLGLSFSSQMSGFNAEQSQRIINSLYKRIRNHHGNFSKVLSPYSLKIYQASYSQPTWTSNPIQLFKKQFRTHRVISTLSNTNPVISQEIKNLKINFYKMTQYLSNKSIKIQEKKLKLSSLPWILLTGPIGSGKSTLIEKSKIKFVIDKNTIQTDLTNNQQHINWNWWITSKAILIDVPSSHISMKRNQDLFANAYWENLLELIVEERGLAGVNSATLVVSLREIMDKSYHSFLIAQLVKKIIDLQTKFGKRLSFNLVISKCDLMPGFCDFFDDYTNEELFQPWGVSFPQVIQSENMTNGFYKPFDFLIQKLNKQVIYRLHQERYLEYENKFHIKNFPLQVELLKETLGEVLQKVIEEAPHFILKGFYLTSAKQFPLNNDQSRFSKGMPNQASLESLTIMDLPTIPDRSYFIKHLLLSGLVSEQNNAT